MFRRILLTISLACLSLGIAGTAFAEGFPFPGKITPGTNTVVPGKIYQSGTTSYMAEKTSDGGVKLSEMRTGDNLNKTSRQFAEYGADGVIKKSGGVDGQPVAPDKQASGTAIGTNNDAIANTATNASGAGEPVTVIVSEKVPGADCVAVEGSGNGVTTKRYRCTVQGGFGTVQKMLGGLIKYATFLTALLGILMVVFSGLQYATSAGDTKQQTAAVSRITKLVGGLILLMLMAFILNTVAPWIYG